MKFFLRELARPDMEVINRWRNDREVQRWLVSPFRFVGEEVDQKWLDAYQAVRTNNIRLAICEFEQGIPVGAVYLLNIDWVVRSAEFGILIGEIAFQEKGAGEFATRSMLNHAFMDMNLHRVDLGVLSSNQRAIRLYKKVGFVEEGCLRQAAFKEGEYADLIHMSMLDSEYKQAALPVHA